jgi:hypothetical protein
MPISTPNRFVWRYLSFGRFVWMLHTKSLWMARVDRLGDDWEMRVSETELRQMVDRNVLTADRRQARREMILAAILRARTWWYANCWTASDDESHAMWSIYGTSTEGVAVRTTLATLSESIIDAHLKAVRYRRFEPHVEVQRTPIRLITRKRPEFSYEREYRIVAERRPAQLPSDARGAWLSGPVGFQMPWDPEQHVKEILVHPGADAAFRVAVEATIEKFAPGLAGCVRASGLAQVPPTLYR